MAFDEKIATELLASEKLLAVGQWLPRPDGAQELMCDFDGDHPQIGRLSMKVRVSAGTPGRFSFVVLLAQPGLRQRDRVYALDVNATPHSNPLKPDDPDSLRLFLAGETHEHHFKDRVCNQAIDTFARPVEPPPLNFLEAATYLYAKLNVTTPPNIPLPPMQGNLV